MQRITPDQPWPLFDGAATRRIEQAAAQDLPPHALMQRAGLAVARMALALAPHARVIWIACGPGNNGGDGLEAALHLQRWGKKPIVTWLGDESSAPPDARASSQGAQAAGVSFASEAPDQCDLAIDALLGIGSTRSPEGRMAQWIGTLNASPCVLAVDLPSGMDGDTGNGSATRASHTLSLLTLKPGLFTGEGRDSCGSIWFDPLGLAQAPAPSAWLAGPPPVAPRRHASHKGSYGDVAVIGGAAGMQGAVLLAASAALHGGAGRVFACLLDNAAPGFDATLPDVMVRAWDALDLSDMHVICGCGGGEAVRAVLPRVLANAGSLVLDADALNAVASDTQLQSLLQARGRRAGRVTVLTPHPLEAARLLACTAAEIQADRLASAQRLARRFQCTVLLKGSGTVIAAPEQTPVINLTGNARLAIAGTGDVLAGWVGARLAAGASAFDAAAWAAYSHGMAADRWPPERPLTASALARCP